MVDVIIDRVRGTVNDENFESGAESALVLERSIVIPALNEGIRIHDSLSKLSRFLESKGWQENTEVVIVTAEGSDNTISQVEGSLALFRHVTHVKPGRKVGKGRDVRLGMMAARGNKVAFMDADLAVPLYHLVHLFDKLDGADVVAGTRDLASIHKQLSRKFTSQMANLLVRLMLLPGAPDTQCGFKGFRREVVVPLFGALETQGWGFDLEVFARARANNLLIEYLPVLDWFDPKGDHGLAGEIATHARLRTLRELIRLNRRFGRQADSRSHHTSTTRQSTTAQSTAGREVDNGPS